MDVCKPKPSDRKTWGCCTKLDLYSKNIYNSVVKVSDWEKYTESLPIDVDPRCPTAFNLHYSHYGKLGNDSLDYATTTQDMLSQVYTRRKEFEVNPNKPMINLFSETDRADNDKKSVCSSAFGADFITTMQHSYQPPYPYILKRLSMAKQPYFLHRILKEPKLCKFLDDDHLLHTQKLQMYKNSKHISYNPCTGYYTDGTLGDTRDIY